MLVKVGCVGCSPFLIENPSFSELSLNINKAKCEFIMRVEALQVSKLLSIKTYIFTDLEKLLKLVWKLSSPAVHEQTTTNHTSFYLRVLLGMLLQYFL